MSETSLEQTLASHLRKEMLAILLTAGGTTGMRAIGLAVGFMEANFDLCADTVDEQKFVENYLTAKIEGRKNLIAAWNNHGPEIAAFSKRG